MKVSLNTKFISGPFGGGMQFANYLREYLAEHHVEVINHLKDSDIDIILHINPFPFLMKSASYSFYDAYAYKLCHPETIIIQRINECDERKGTRYMNKLQMKTSDYSDYIVFISNWLKLLYLHTGLKTEKKQQVILNGADESIFNTENKVIFNKNEKLRLVTHHWGGGFLKGHDIYQKLDHLLENEPFRNRFEFTFIGNIPKNMVYRNSVIIKPLHGNELAEELKRHHLYITASRNEPAGMHHIEGALCGLPLLYINSGALPEYCEQFGLAFNEDNFEEQLIKMYEEFSIWEQKMKDYCLTANKMAGEYHDLLVNLYKNKKSYAFYQSNPFKSLIYQVYSKLYHIIKKITFWLCSTKFR